MSKFDEIRSFDDCEVNDAVQSIIRHPMLKALMNFTFPDVDEKIWSEQLKNTHSIYDFQKNFISHTISKILETSSQGLTNSGFDKLDKNTSYLFVSNHRDIVLDTSLLNLVLLEKDYIMTSSAIGDNLVQQNFLHILAKLNRNFLVQRGLSLREQLKSSQLMSEYIFQLLKSENRSVWIAQREGRTKDGNDATQQGVLKMLAMASKHTSLSDFFKDLRIVPLSISYEYDPTDVLKMPQLIANQNDEVYIKAKDEDFTTMMSGVLGQKKRIHLHAGNVINHELDDVFINFENKNKQLQAIAQIIDESIIQNYQLWPTNYIAYDILNQTNRFSENYTEKEKQLFERRLEMRINIDDIALKKGFLSMYANPVINKMKLMPESF
ncbi:MAG: 1-acyl-sn-glycerol-3-phosphate acyltransferase [Chryseobacterium sp.]|jgi:predicted nuclease of predicted toxin-antitoxin system|uniref:1-acyl-sn-glycerol-3-phosphate acyltransferase n=1 Tax=Chryseobacterium sp. TaxID=1871047 RepID=UPI00261EE30D|nr:1-acyl-sn-glycerol-3-phosphate acyltransferase [Chryseobacterium sp.]MDF2550952.1 1-acyl-sn-glycerol-3-phosphate acyltransferase [Chryseobacterium sp.]